MSYCVNPACPQPDNPDNARRCQACGSELILHDRYRAIKALGQGGFGATFVAADESLPGKPQAVIKQLRPASTTPHVLDMARQLFKREAATLGRLGDHPQVPRLLDYFEVSQQFYLVQEYISGQTLKQELKRTGPFTEYGVKEFLREILPLLKYLHQNEVIHRDIKPANIIRREMDQKLVLIDFGAVKDEVHKTALMEAGSTGQTAFTSFAIGTPGYAPQEQLALRPVYASDIYAVGATCLYLLTGQSPNRFGYDSRTGEILWRPQVPYISDSFAQVLAKMLAVSVRDRFKSAEEVMRALDVASHLGSLTEGMVSQVPTINQADDPTHLETENFSFLPTHIRQAREIQAYKAKKGQSRKSASDTQLERQLTVKPTAATRLGNTVAVEKQRPTKWDAAAVLLAYGKGRKDFADCDLSGLQLTRITLTKTNFYGAKLDRSSFQESDLSGANFARASLIQATFRDANLAGASFSYANLAGADLRGANLSNASFISANLRGANLCGANLTGARITQQQLDYAKTNWLTIKPNGKRSFFG